METSKSKWYWWIPFLGFCWHTEKLDWAYYSNNPDQRELRNTWVMFYLTLHFLVVLGSILYVVKELFKYFI